MVAGSHCARDSCPVGGVRNSICAAQELGSTAAIQQQHTIHPDQTAPPWLGCLLLARHTPSLRLYCSTAIEWTPGGVTYNTVLYTAQVLYVHTVLVPSIVVLDLRFHTVPCLVCAATGSTVSALLIDDLGFMPQLPQEVPPTQGWA